MLLYACQVYDAWKARLEGVIIKHIGLRDMVVTKKAVFICCFAFCEFVFVRQ